MKQFYSSSMPYAIHQILEWLGISLPTAWVAHGLKILFLLAYTWLLIMTLTRWQAQSSDFARALLLAYAFFLLQLTSPLVGWYLLWLLPWVLLSHWPKQSLLFWLITTAGLFSYFKRVNYLLLIALAFYALALIFDRMQQRKRA